MHKVEKALWAVKELNKELPEGMSITADPAKVGIVSAFGVLTIDGEEFDVRINCRA